MKLKVTARKWVHAVLWWPAAALPGDVQQPAEK